MQCRSWDGAASKLFTVNSCLRHPFCSRPSRAESHVEQWFQMHFSHFLLFTPGCTGSIFVWVPCIICKVFYIFFDASLPQHNEGRIWRARVSSWNHRLRQSKVLWHCQQTYLSWPNLFASSKNNRYLLNLHTANILPEHLFWVPARAASRARQHR